MVGYSPLKTVVLQGGLADARTMLGREEAMVYDVANDWGLDVKITTEKHMARGRFVMDPSMIAVGGVMFVKHALRQLGFELPRAEPYPVDLKHLFYRKIYRSLTMAEVRHKLNSGQRLFVKPVPWKRFTGFVAEFSTDYRFNGCGGAVEVWAAEPVVFVSEWRAYVADGKVLDVRFADHGGDREVLPDRAVIDDAVALLTKNGAPRGYVIDFGVLSTGETALVEMNDGFSFGAYDGVSPQTLSTVLLARWIEITRSQYGRAPAPG